MSPLKVVLVSPTSLILKALEGLSREGPIEVVARCHDSGEAFLEVVRRRPEVVVIDRDLPDLLKLLARLRAECPGSKAVLVEGLEYGPGKKTEGVWLAFARDAEVREIAAAILQL